MWNKNLSFLLILLLSVSCQKDMLTWDLERLPEVAIIAEPLSADEIMVTYQVISESPVSELNLHWGEESNPAIHSNTREIDPSQSKGYVLISGLCEASLYHFRAEAKNKIGTSLSNEAETLTLAITSDTQPVIDFKADVNEIFPGESVNFTNHSYNVSCSGQWKWYINDSVFSVDYSSALLFSKTGTFSISLEFLHPNGQLFEVVKEDYIMVGLPLYPEGTVHCSELPTEVSFVMIPQTGKLWVDRNLGASQVATAPTDEAAYGDLYQWGRFSDGHQCRNSLTTSEQSASDIPWHDNFILSNSGQNWDWRAPQNNNLWQGVNGANNPCPVGFRLPTEAEWEQLFFYWPADNINDAFTSPLKLPAAGSRSDSNGSFTNIGSAGRYWSSTVSGTRIRRFIFGNNYANSFNSSRASGSSVRCIED